ncbi:MAG TPA: hypothetical protein VJP40_00225 [bacterium]|nr:hypothetical protein [bacterium]
MFYILLPVLFLALTVAFIQFTPKTSHTEVGDSCETDDQCCTTSGCGPQEISEVCELDTCKRINVGCDDGTVSDNGVDCVCVDDDGEVVGECVVCAPGEIFVDPTFSDEGCSRICGPGEDPDDDDCTPVGAFIEGAGIGCSFSMAASSGPGLPTMLMGLGMATAAFVARRRK